MTFGRIMAKDIKNISFCKVSDEIIENQVKTYIKLVSKPKYVCNKCHRLANKKKNLCHPNQVKKIAS
jgi:hypothetical protein